MNQLVQAILSAAHQAGFPRKHHITTGFEVQLLDWNALDRATDWCNSMWTTQGMCYGRRIDAAEKTAIFILPTELDQIDFLLRFG